MSDPNSEEHVDDTPETPEPVLGMNLTNKPRGIKKLNKRGAAIAVGLVGFACSVAVWGIVKQSNESNRKAADTAYVASSTDSFANSYLAGRPEGVIGEPIEPPEPKTAVKALREERQDDTIPADTTAPAIDDPPIPDPSLVVLEKQQQDIAALAHTETLRILKQRNEKLQEAVTSVASVNFNRSGDPTMQARSEDSQANDQSGPLDMGITDQLNQIRQTTLNQATREASGAGSPIDVVGTLSQIGIGGRGANYSDINRQEQKSAFVERQQQENVEKHYLANTRVQPLAKNELKAGGVIPAILITGINSDLPGQLLAQVSHNVLDTANGEFVLIPQGAKLVGRYDNDVSYGQTRTLVVWNRIIYPDGSSLDLRGMQGHDTEGYSGFNDRVNNHYLRVFGSAILMSFVSTAVTISGQGSDDPFENRNREAEALSESLGREVGRVATEVVRRNLRIAPTLEIRPGFRFAVFVNKDIVLTPYEPMQSLLRKRGK